MERKALTAATHSVAQYCSNSFGPHVVAAIFCAAIVVDEIQTMIPLEASLTGHTPIRINVLLKILELVIAIA